MQVVEMAELLELNLPEGMDYETILDRARELSKDLRVENREQLPLRVRQELARAKRENWCLSLLFLRLMTVSQLAKAGQTHEAEKLQHIAARHLQEVTRECDAIFRLNLSTFCLMATNTPMEGVERLIQRLMAKLGATTVEVGGDTIEVQFAFGVVLRDKDSKNDVNVESFLLKANDNLSDAIQRHELVVTTTF
jgi:GGDEF domain-containing protein